MVLAQELAFCMQVSVWSLGCGLWGAVCGHCSTLHQGVRYCGGGEAISHGNEPETTLPSAVIWLRRLRQLWGSRTLCNMFSRTRACLLEGRVRGFPERAAVCSAPRD